MVPVSVGTTLAMATLVDVLSSWWVPLIIALVLLILLVHKELLSCLPHTRAKRISQALTIPIVPLFILFLMSIAVRVYLIMQ